MHRFIVLSGCSGGGKSTLINELGARGFATVAEPGRRLLRQELEHGGSALPWADKVAFVRAILDLALRDYANAARQAGWVFFDRSLVDALSALQHLTGEPALADLGPAYRYNRRVFITPPWPEIYVTDAERRHDFAAAQREYDRLRQDYPALGYKLCLLPKATIAERANIVLEALGGGS